MTGRWPANVILSPDMAEVLDRQSGKLHAPGSNGRSDGNTFGFGVNAQEQKPGYTDSGGASRFFLSAGYEPWELEWILSNGLKPCG